SRALPLALFLAALALRLWHPAALRALPSFEHPYEGLDAELYTRLALSIAGGDLFPHGITDAAPLYAYWLAAFARIAGDGTLAPRLAQAFLGALAAPLLWSVGRRISGPGAGAFAGAAAALFPPLLLYEGSLQSAALVPFLGALLLASLLPARPGAGPAILSGFILGISCLNRPDLLPLVLLVPLWLLLTAGRRSAVFLLAGALLPIVPFGAAASVRAGGLVPLTSHGGIHFHVGNHEGADGTLSPVEEIRPTPEGFARDARLRANKETGRGLAPAEVSRFFFRKGLAWIASHPKDWLVLLGQKTLLFWNDYEVPNNEDLYFLRRHSAPLRLPIPLFGIVAALAVYGFFLGAFRGGARALLALVVLAVFAGGLLFFVTGRYRLPAVPPLLLLAGGGLAAWIGAIRARRSLALLLLPLLLFTNLPVRRFDSAAAETRLASSFYRAGDLLSAEEAYRRAERVHPGLPEARRGIARILAETGETDEAASLYRAIARNPRERKRARADLASLLARSGRTEEAIALLDSVLAEDPSDAGSLANLGALRMNEGRDALAERLLREAIALDPESPEAHLNLALIRTRQGRLDEAIRLFDRLLEIDGFSERGLFNAGAARAMSGDLVGAIRDWEKLRRIRPSYPNLEANLERARGLLRERPPDPDGSLPR
ncbi:MAG: tetratricopeptide repeat protein, partial [Candidatus Eisenbacteria bacterium]